MNDFMAWHGMACCKELVILLVVAGRIPLNENCSDANHCEDGNAHCADGVCLCVDTHFEKNYACGMLLLFGKQGYI